MLNAPLMRPADVTLSTAERIRPHRRVLPSQAAERWLANDKGHWDPKVAPMMAEPLDQLASREYQGIVFVGPQRSSKSFGLIFGGLTWVTTSAPGDAKVIQMTETAARKWSRTDLDRVIQHSPEIQARMSPRARDDNVFDKWFRSGMALSIGWPAVSHLSSETIKYVFIPDYERPENRDNVDGSGPLWDLAFKRIQTYMSRGKCLAESSPGEDCLSTTWKPSTPHEAPPVRGILSVYNNGTRARWYWPCWHCNEYFQAEPGFSLFALPEFDDLKKLVVSEQIDHLAEKYSRVVCPHCGGLHEPEMKSDMNFEGMWLHEGQSIRNGKRLGDPRGTNIWSGWLGGAAASYQHWHGIVRNYLQGVLTYVRTSDESPMKLATTSDAGMAYIPQAIRNRRTSEQLVSRLEDWEYGSVPAGVIFLTAAVDVQANRFVIEVWGWGRDLERWLIDRFTISSSRRPEGDGRMAALDPAGYAEDWRVLVDLIHRRYDGRGIRIVMCDSGGKAGVTEKAYEFWRWLRGQQLGDRLMLVKGTGRPSAARVKMTWPDSQDRKDRNAGGRGDVPVWLLNTNVLKDGIAGDLGRDFAGPGFVHLPLWINQKCPTYFDELLLETRGSKGWEPPSSGGANEAFDLLVYNRVAVIALKAEQIDWDNPPDWLLEPVEHAEPSEAPQADNPSSGGYLSRRPGYLGR